MKFLFETPASGVNRTKLRPSARLLQVFNMKSDLRPASVFATFLLVIEAVNTL